MPNKHQQKRANALPGGASQIFALIRALSSEQQRYAAALIKSRRRIVEQPTLSRSDVLDALEIARSTPPERIAQEMAELHPTFTTEIHRTYDQYKTAKGWL